MYASLWFLSEFRDILDPVIPTHSTSHKQKGKQEAAAACNGQPIHPLWHMRNTSEFTAKNALLTSHLPNIEKQLQWQSEAIDKHRAHCAV